MDSFDENQGDVAGLYCGGQKPLSTSLRIPLVNESGQNKC
jgi:hypothetical protein